MSQQPTHRYHKLPWWKRIALDRAYRQRVRNLATQRYRAEMQLLQYAPCEVAAAAWDDGRPIPHSSQYICVEEESCAWATRHPESMAKVSAFRNLRTAAAAVVIAGSRTEEREAEIIAEVKQLYDAEAASERLYGLSYVWNRPLPPNGFIRVWPSPISAMWPALLAAEVAVPPHVTLSAPGSHVALPPGMKPACLTDPLCVNVFRRSGEYLGAWRQSLFLVRFKVICWALHEEERRRTCGVVGRPVLASDKAIPAAACGRTLRNVPVFPLPLLRLQRGTATFSEKTCRLNLHSLHAPLTWEGIAPAPSTYRAEQAYQNWHALHRSSAVVRQAVRDVFNLLAHNERGLLTKTTYVAFVLDLLNLFFPTRISSANIAIAEEEWVYRGTTDLVSFETFYEKFFSFPFIFLRDLNTVTRDQYVEVWCLIRVCLLEDAESITSNMRRTVALASSTTKSAGTASLNTTVTAAHVAATRITGYSRPRRPMTVLEATLCSMDKLKNLGRREVLPLIGDIHGVTREDVLLLGERDFHNTDNYALHEARQAAAAAMLQKERRALSPAQLTAVVHARGKQLLSRVSRAVRRQQMQEEAQRLQSCGTDGRRSTDSEENSVAAYEGLKLDEEKAADEDGTSSIHSRSFSVPRSRQEKRGAKAGWTDGTVGRRAALEKIEEERVRKQLLETSVLYRHRRMRRHTEHAKVLSHVSRSHSAWELYRQDVFDLPHESQEEEDQLLAFVRDLPDDFFEDTNSLRVRYGVYAARLRAVAERARHDNPLATGPLSPALLQTNFSNTFSGAELDSNSSYLSPSTPLRGVLPSSRALKLGRRPLPGATGQLSSASNLSRMSVEKAGASLVEERKAASPTPSLASGAAARRNPADEASGDRDGNEVSLRRREAVEPGRAMHLRLQLKQELDRRYEAMLARRPRRLLPSAAITAGKKGAATGRSHVGVGARRRLPQQGA
ncbi:uncharacterized protein Tco025E_02686 [Trypanosoma conorhini]|uniref:Uncharacterized protein n=1 Tax=Trypanosoma conorhini TaxID=83891 RepID=A0A3R7LBM4_9TRYP|nr:uncharacterized protein Tco025E_02686 [Trypanosoma conorhini]RNF23949.1 hypothetical protein Tco025E_02686 [Trypanosoma conorhini]